MQTILAISCSTAHASVACLHNNQLNLIHNAEDNQHSEIILSLVHQSLANIPLKQVDCIAVDIGPGSFMGIRTAVATAQGLAFSHNIPVYSLSSLHILALSVIAKNHHLKGGRMISKILTALDARRQEWYFAHWQITSKSSAQTLYQSQVSPIQSPIVTSPENCITEDKLSLQDEGILAGDVWHEESERTAHHPDDRDIRYPNAGILAQIAQHNAHLWHHSDALNPLYVRDNVATPAG